MTCPYASSGCNGPKESDCLELCMPRPKAELHPIIASALAPFAPPPRTPEEEAKWVAADLARVRDQNSPDYEQRRADRIQRRDADRDCAMSGCWLPGEKL